MAGVDVAHCAAVGVQLPVEQRDKHMAGAVLGGDVVVGQADRFSQWGGLRAAAVLKRCRRKRGRAHQAARQRHKQRGRHAFPAGVGHHQPQVAARQRDAVEEIAANLVCAAIIGGELPAGRLRKLARQKELLNAARDRQLFLDPAQADALGLRGLQFVVGARQLGVLGGHVVDHVLAGAAQARGGAAQEVERERGVAFKHLDKGGPIKHGDVTINAGAGGC